MNRPPSCPGVILDDSVVFTTDLKAAVEGMDLLVLAVPSPFTRSTAHRVKGCGSTGTDHRKRCKGRGRKHADDAFSDH